MAVSKRAKARFKLLFDVELMGAKRVKEITRWCDKR